jgi:hypothetical protein
MQCSSVLYGHFLQETRAQKYLYPVTLDAKDVGDFNQPKKAN